MTDINKMRGVAPRLRKELGGTSAAEQAVLDGATAGGLDASKAVIRTAASGITLKTLAINAAGSSQSNATAMTADVNIVAASDGTKGVKLPTAVVGHSVTVVNTVATTGNTLKVYPATGAAINGGSANAAVVLGPGKSATFSCTALLTWYCPDVVFATATTTELNYVSSITPGTQAASKAVVADANTNIGISKVTQLHIGTSGSETQVTATAAQLNTVAVTTPGVVEAGKAVIAAASTKNIDEVHATALYLGSGAGTQVTATAAQLNTLAGASAGIAAVLAGGLGGSVAFTKTSTGANDILAANASKDRACLVVAYVTETFADGDGGQTVVTLGEETALTKCFSSTSLASAAAGTTLVFAFTNTSTKKVQANITAATGTGTGAVTITVLGIPTS